MIRFSLAHFVILVISFALASSSQAQTKLKYVFYFIGDGMGLAQIQLAEYYLQEITPSLPGVVAKPRLLMNKMPVAGVITTHSADSLVTDSAAAGTALATGVKTNNHIISLDPKGKKLITLVEALQEIRWKTGIVTTTRITHATPAVFVSHVPHRDEEQEIANQISKAKVDFLAGGGLANFVPQNGKIKSKRKDDADLIKVMAQQGYEIFSGEENGTRFLSTDFAKISKTLALFASSHLPYEIDRLRTKSQVPALSQIVERAINSLSYGNRPFFLMVEGGRIDHACHSNDVAAMIQEVLSFDQALAQAYDFYLQHPKETLILVLADHETGGLGLGIGKEYLLAPSTLRPIAGSIDELVKDFDFNRQEVFFQQLSSPYGLANLAANEKVMLEQSLQATKLAVQNKEDYKMSPAQVAISQIIAQRAKINWTTFVHTAMPIPLSAVGINAEKFGGHHDNTEVAKMLADLLQIKIGPP